MSLEIEQKFRVDDFDPLREKVTALGAEPLGVAQQCDRYFSHPGRDFRQTGEALRIRSTDGAACITYKGPKLDAVVKTRREIELPLGCDGADFVELLCMLGFSPVAEVRKQRERFSLSAGEIPLEVVFDTVDGVGLFVEVESIAQVQTMNPAQAAVVQLAETLGLSDLEPRSYLRMLLESRTE